MDVRFWLISSLWIGVYVGEVTGLTVEEQLKEMISLLSTNPEKGLDLPQTYVDLEELLKNGRGLDERELTQMLMDWITHPNNGKYIHSINKKLMKHNIEIEREHASFVGTYINHETNQNESDSYIAKLYDDSMMEPDEFYALLKEGLENNLPHHEKVAVSQLAAMNEGMLSYDQCKSPFRISFPYKEFSKELKIDAYLKRIKTIFDDDCSFEALSVDDIQDLPIENEVDCERILVKNRIRLSFREIFDTSRSLVENPSKCPSLAHERDLLNVVARIPTCSESGCCDVIRLEPRQSVPQCRYHEEFFTFYYHYYYRAWEICSVFIRSGLSRKALNLGSINSDVDVTWNKIQRRQSRFHLPGGSQRLLNYLKRTLREPCNEIIIKLSPVFEPHLSIIRWFSLDQYFDTATKALHDSWNQCIERIDDIEKMVAALSQNDKSLVKGKTGSVGSWLMGCFSSPNRKLTSTE